jgi:hypothetical protein
MNQPNPFTRLPARRYGIVRRASVWDAGEYLLSISGTLFSENYKRFYYRDIKAIVLQKGPRLGSIGALLFTLLLGIIFISIAMPPLTSDIVRWLWTVPVLWLVYLIYVNLAQSCRVFVYTAVSSEELPAIYRRRSAARVIPFIRNRIEAAQGMFNPAGVLEHESVPVPPQASPIRTEPAFAARPTLYTSLVFFFSLLGSAAFAFWYSDTLLTASALTQAKIAFSILNALEVISGVWALAKLFQVRMLSSLRITVFAGLGLLAFRSYSLILLFSNFSVRGGTLTETMLTVRARHWVGTTDCAFSLLVGIAGLICLLMSWQDNRPGPTPVASGFGGPLSNL